MEQPTRFIGMDVHKDTIVVAVTAAGDVGKAMPYGTFPNTPAALEELVRRLRQAGSGPMKFCYEAGPCGYGVQRTLTKLGEDCMALPDNQQDSATAEALRAIVEFDLSDLLAIEPPRGFGRD
jgi:transposase